MSTEMPGGCNKKHGSTPNSMAQLQPQFALLSSTLMSEPSPFLSPCSSPVILHHTISLSSTQQMCTSLPYRLHLDMSERSLATTLNTLLRTLLLTWLAELLNSTGFHSGLSLIVCLPCPPFPAIYAFVHTFPEFTLQCFFFGTFNTELILYFQVVAMAHLWYKWIHSATKLWQ